MKRGQGYWGFKCRGCEHWLAVLDSPPTEQSGTFRVSCRSCTKPGNYSAGTIQSFIAARDVP
jgi:hypothetical protein